MDYYFIRSTMRYGPWNFPVEVAPGGTLARAIDAAAKRQGVIVCCDWTAEPIDEHEFHHLVGG